jgi:hypothetical protein
MRRALCAHELSDPRFIMSNFTSFFSFGKRICFDLKYCGKTVVSVDETLEPHSGRFEVGEVLLEIVPVIRDFTYRLYEEGIGLNQQEIRAFRFLAELEDYAEYPADEVFSSLALFAVVINNA